MKQTTDITTQQPSVPPVSTGDADTAGEGLPPAHAGGSDSESDTVAGLQEENERLRASIRLDRAHRRITDELVMAGARSPELLFASIAGDLQFDDGGEIANAAALIKRLKTAFPEQFGVAAAASIDAGAGARSAPRLTKEALAKMKPSEIAALDWNDVRRVLSN